MSPNIAFRVWDPEKKQWIYSTQGSIPYVYLSLEGKVIVNGEEKPWLWEIVMTMDKNDLGDLMLVKEEYDDTTTN